MVNIEGSFNQKSLVGAKKYPATLRGIFSLKPTALNTSSSKQFYHPH